MNDRWVPVHPDGDLPGQEITVPSHWQFQERGVPGITYIIADQKRNFLSLTTPDRPGVASGYKGEFADYFFDHRGKPSEWRSHHVFGTTISLGNDIRGVFRIHEWGGPDEHANIDVMFTNPENEDQRPIAALGNLRYGSQWMDNKEHPYVQLETASFGNNFRNPINGITFPSPAPILGLKLGTMDVLHPGNWELNTAIKDHNGFTSYQIAENEIIFLNEQGEQEYTLTWTIENGVLILGEVHWGDEHTMMRLLKAKIRVPMEEVAASVFSKSTRNQEAGQLETPWRNLDKILGARFGYASTVSGETEDE